MNVRPELAQLLVLLEEAFARKSFHGTTLRGSLRGLTASAASWRPGPGRHNIWELALHAAFWKYVVRRRLTGDRRVTFALPGSDWFVRPVDANSTPDEKQWRSDIALLSEEHRMLRDTIVGTSKKLAPPQLRLVRGVIAHDLYHAGQIQLLKRLASGKA